MPSAVFDEARGMRDAGGITERLAAIYGTTVERHMEDPPMTWIDVPWVDHDGRASPNPIIYQTVL